MTEYNEGARGRARYWMGRAQRAEAECERLRSSRDKWKAVASGESPLVAPPPEGEPSGVKESLTTPDQAHGDANDPALNLLREIDAAREKMANAEGDCEDPLTVIRRHLTASGVPEEVRWLPERLRNGLLPTGDRVTQRAIADELERALASAPADGWPDRFYEAVGWTLAECCAALDRGEDPRQMEAPALLERCKRDLSRDAAAPSDGGSDE